MSSLFHPSSGVRTLGVVWIVVWAALGSALVPRLLASGGEPAPALPTVGPPAANGLGTPADGTTARVVSLEMSASETTIVVQVEGRDVAGERLVFRGPAFLVDANGRQHLERGGSINGRTLTLRFDGAGTIPEGTAELRLSGVGLTADRSIAPVPAQVTYMADTTHPVAVRATHGPLRSLPGAHRAEALAHGAVSVDEVLVDDAVVVVRGHLIGFSREEIQAISLGHSVLLTEDGRHVTLTGGRSGFGQDLQQFELHFKRASDVAAAGVRLQLDVKVAPQQLPMSSPDTAARMAELERSAGATATLAISSR